MVLEAPPKEKCTPFLIFAVFIAAFGGFLFGYHTGIIAGALVYLAPAFQLSIGEQSMVVSILLIGAILGAILAGFLADRWGRKKAMGVTAVLFAIGAAIIAYSDSYTLLLIGRLVSGLGVGLITVAAPLYLAEISPPQFRGRFVSMYQLLITIGILVSFIVNYLFSMSADWRWMFAIGIFPAVFQMLAIFFLPETPAWSFKQGQDQKAIATLGRLRKDKQWMQSLAEMKSSASPQKRGEWKHLFSAKLGSILLIGGVLSAFQQLTGINTVIYYAPKIFQEAGFASSTGAILATLGIGIINVPATLLAVWLLDKWGRRPLLLVGLVGMVFTLSFLSLAFYTQSQMVDVIATLSLMGYIVFFAIGLGAVTWVLVSEIYPLKVRGKAMTIATLINFLCNFLISITFLHLIEQLGVHGTFGIYAVISVIAFGFVWRFIPETKGKSLEEIEKVLLR